MPDRYDPIPDLAALLAASVHENAIPSAIRLASRLRISPESGAKLAEARICEALALLFTAVAESKSGMPTLAGRVTAILTAAGYRDSRDVFPGAFLATGTGSSIAVSIPWVNGDDADRGRALKRFAKALRDGGLYVRERDCWLQVHLQPGEVPHGQ